VIAAWDEAIMMVASFLDTPSNNGMHPTANSAAFIRKTWMVV